MVKRGVLYPSLILVILLWQLPVSGQVTASINPPFKEICLGDSVKATLRMTGKSPWTVVVESDLGDKISLEKITSPFDIWLKPTANDRYFISSVVDRDGDEGNAYGSLIITINPITPVEFVQDITAYWKIDPEFALVSDPPGAEFFGYGVVNSMFYPSVATPKGSPHEISCVYTNQYGCKSQDVIDIFVLHGESEVSLYLGTDPIQTVCDDGLRYEIRGTNLDNLSGTFKLMEEGSTDSLTGHIVDEDPLDNLATLKTAGLAGAYVLEYSYGFETLMDFAKEQILVNDLEGIQFEGLPEIVCSGDGPFLLSPGQVENDPDATYIFTGPGVSGNQSDGYFFNPAVVEVGKHTLKMDYTSSNGCHVMVEREIQNNFSPEASFTFAPACIPDEGGVVSFSNTSSGKYAVERWEWDFGDPESGSENSSNEENPDHLYGSSGEKEIILVAYSVDGCVSERIMDTVFVNQPVADFMWFHDCLIPGEKIPLINLSESSYSSIDSLEWTAKTAAGGILGSISSNSPGDTIRFPFVEQESYYIQLEVWNQEGCSAQLTKEITIKPTYKITESGYLEAFNGSSSGWTKVSDDQVSSWVLDIPDFNGFNPVPGDRAWFTVLPDGDTYMDRSWIESPCFDFTHSQKPVISLDLMKSFVPGVDGAVLQYSEGYGEGWFTLGNVREGSNWYNLLEIENEPGGSDFGWGSVQFVPDTEWLRAQYSMEEFTGSPHLKFRIVIATGAATELGNQGFAFDNFSISEFIRVSLLEHFTNSSQDASKNADDVVDDFVSRNRGRVIDLQYHVDYPGLDLMNENNAYPPEQRNRYYGVPSVPYALLNGREEPEYRFDYSVPSEQPNDEILQQASVEEPLFSMDLDVDWRAEDYGVSVTTRCEALSFTSNIDLYVVILESLVTAYTGLNQDTTFRNVVLDMLPTPAGKLLDNTWEQGDFITQSYDRVYPNGIEDFEDLMVVAFLRDRDNKEIIQATANYMTPPVGFRVPRADVVNLSIYPNPAGELVNVNLGERAHREGRLLITDLFGRTMLETSVVPSYAIYPLQISSLPQGMYLISWFEGGVLKGQNKLIRIR